MNSQKTIFLTGGTGLLGSYLLKIFLENNHKVFALSRSSKEKTSQNRILEVLKFWDTKFQPDNLVILEGDVGKDNLALSNQTLQELRDSVEEIYHSAAITDLNRPINEITNINVTGTKRILDLSDSFAKNGLLKKINHISTAYVYGNYHNKFTEKDLDVGQGFDTNYEKTKFEAEKIVVEFRKKGLWVDIFRPSMIMGDSIEGKTFQFKHVYQFINLCRIELFDTLPIKDARLSLVPIDLTANAIYVLANTTKEKNKTFHPIPTDLVPIETIINTAAKLANFKKPKITSLEEFIADKFTPTQQAILRATILSVNFKINLDSTDTNAILKSCGFTMPNITNSLLERILTYFLRKQR
ncbi:MAG: SDR family oxidoreductase [Candidatus Omnitrophica bacterium]|nr:SDR family oxidoreductase [Candidatus Omnitrophota bacterium]